MLFSFNSPVGACPRCQGFGNTIDFDMDRVIPDKTLSLDEGAVDPWTKPKYRSWLGNFKKHAKGGVRLTTPFCDLTEAERETVYAFIRRFFDHLETQEVQAARARFPEPLSRLRAVPGVPRRAPAQGGALRAGGRQEPGATSCA